MMALNFPDPEDFGKSGPKPCEKIDSNDYHSLFDFEEEDNGDT